MTNIFVWIFQQSNKYGDEDFVVMIILKTLNSFSPKKDHNEKSIYRRVLQYIKKPITISRGPTYNVKIYPFNEKCSIHLFVNIPLDGPMKKKPTI